MYDSSVPYPNASTEPLGAIESATCYAYPEDLVTRRFRRLFNEIARLQLLAEELDMATSREAESQF